MRNLPRSSRARFRGALSTAALVLLGSIATSKPARADSPTCPAADRECGRQAFAQGTTLFDQKDYSQARAWFLAAQQAGAHPVIAFNLALCSARLGKPNQARSELLPLIGDPALDGALRERAKLELAAAEAALAHVYLEAAEPRATTIELDGEHVEASGGELVLDPGQHRFRLSSGETVVFDQEIQLEPGEKLRLRLINRSRAIDVVVVPDSRRARPAEPAPHSGFSPVWFYVCASATVLLSTATLWSGLDVENAYDDYRADLPNLSQREADARVESGHSRELRTNLLLGGTVLSAAGTALLGFVFVDWRPLPTSSTATVTFGPSHANVRFSF
jgi:hypothetical protein